ncbi:MAG: CAP domain-containing protein, partial [Microcystaceae cyanobacterium]
MAISATDRFDGRVLELVNEERAKFNLNTLTLSEKLDTAADLYSRDLALNDYFDHTGRDGSSPGDRIEKAGYTLWTTWGENIAAGYVTPESVVQAWIDSPDHRANILNADFTHMGLGYTFLANDEGKINFQSYWAQDFGAGDPDPGQYIAQNDLSPPIYTTIKGTKKKDELTGDFANNIINGYAGDDLLRGKEGDDQLFG